jgi:hypothetical protein
MFCSTAEILRPKKRIKVEDLSTVTIGYIKDISTQTDSMTTKGLEFYLILDVVLQ